MLFNESWKNLVLGLWVGKIMLAYGIDGFSLIWWIWIFINLFICTLVIWVYGKVKDLYNKRGVL